MRRFLLTLFLLFSILILKAQDTILLFHPTAYNLELFSTMHEKGRINLDGYHVLGVYHTRGSYDYDQSADWIEEKDQSRFSLREMEGPLSAEVVFRDNECTQAFLQLYRNSRAAFFMGGPDIPPALYGEPVHLLTRVTDPYRHYLEASFLFHLLGGSQNTAYKAFMKRGDEFLVSGICLGMQTLHVATGGRMIQDIPTELYGLWNAEEVLALPGDRRHRNYHDLAAPLCEKPTSYHFHRIRVKKGSFLQKELPYQGTARPQVLSSHHQALETAGENWLVSATSMDGKIIEAIEHQEYPHVVGVQFHPEKPGIFDPAIRHRRDCGTEGSFYEEIEGSESYSFHLAYWSWIRKTLELIRSQ